MKARVFFTPPPPFCYLAFLFISNRASSKIFIGETIIFLDFFGLILTLHHYCIFGTTCLCSIKLTPNLNHKEWGGEREKKKKKKKMGLKNFTAIFQNQTTRFL
jgi:hypothetical protein